MRLATITNWAYGLTVVLTAASAGTMLLASNAQKAERDAVAQRYALDKASWRMGEDLFALTDHARQYLNTGDATYRTLYQREAELLVELEDRIVEIDNAGATASELDALEQAIRWADTLHDEQLEAITAYDAGEEQRGRMLLFGPEYERQLTAAETDLQRFRDNLDARTANAIREATALSQWWTTISQAALVITGLMFFCVLFFVFRQRVLRPVVRLSDVVNRLAAQDYAVEPPEIADIDEIGDIAQAISLFRETGLERQRLERQRDEENAQRELLSRMTQRLQGCDNLHELTVVVSRFMPDVAPGHAGRLYILDSERNAMIEACQWLEPCHSQEEFAPLDCWALRRGVPHRATQGNIDMPCKHLRAAGSLPATICLPLTAQRETYGLLYLECLTDSIDAPATSDAYLDMLAENTALALANLKLRAALRDMAMRDPLTGLANRHQYAATIHELVETARRNEKPLAALMIDVDHFKQFNDSWGHDAGDTVLREVGNVLRSSKRENDAAFRMGGEEFLVLLPNLDADMALIRAEEIRARIAALDLAHDGQDLGPITVSVGAASAPSCCAFDKLVHDADTALLRAKESGRNQVVLASEKGNPPNLLAAKRR